MINKLIIYCLSMLLLLPTPLMGREASIKTTNISTKSVSANSKDKVEFSSSQGSTSLPDTRKHPVVVYSSQAGSMETMELFNPDTLAVHSYITSIGYLMEFIQINKKNSEYINVRFQGGIYAVHKSDITRYFAVSDIQSFPHYMNEGGTVVHYVEGNPVAENSWSYKSYLGTAPAWMQENQAYYSFDGIYFVDNIQKLGQIKADKKAVNKGYPYYAYYLYLPMRSKTSYNFLELSDGFNQYFGDSGYVKQASKLLYSGKYFFDAQERYGINALLFLSIAINESAYGTSGYAIEQNNLFGYNAVDSYPDNADKFTSVEQGILEVANLISWSYGDADYLDSRNYYGTHLGNKASGMNVKYASDPYWGEKAATNMWWLDSYLGHQDFQQYALGIVKQQTKVFWDDKLKKPAFIYKKSTSTLEYMYPVILHDTQSKSNITLEPPYNINKVVGELDETGGQFKWYRGYVKKKSYIQLNDAK